MGKRDIQFTEHYSAVMRRLTSGGLLLGSYDAAGTPNIMTVGWGSLGSIWGIPGWIVLVRPSRHTYQGIEHGGVFSVNVPTADMSAACETCGTLSGRDVDKFAKCGLTAEKGQTVLAPVVAQCPIVYECQVVHSNDVMPERLDEEIISGFHVNGDFHRVYFGKILSARAEANAAELLGE